MIAQEEIFRRAEERCDVIVVGQATLGEEISSGSAGTEDGDVQGRLLLLRD